MPAESCRNEAGVRGGLTFFRDEAFEEHDGVLVACPAVHFPVAVASLFGQFVPGFGFGKELGDGALGETEDVFGEEALADVVDREELPDAPGDVEGVQVLAGVFVHVVAEHLLEARLHRVALRDEALSQPADHCSRHAELVPVPEGASVVVEPVGALEAVVVPKEVVDG